MLNLLLDALGTLPEFIRLTEAVLSRRLPAEIDGLSHIHKAHLAAALAEKTGRRIIVLCPDELTAKKMAADLSALSDAPAALLPERDLGLTGAAAASHEWEFRRITALDSFLRGETRLLAASAAAALLPALSPRDLARLSFSLKEGESLPVEDLCDRLIRAGYVRSSSVEGVGQFALRGGILDFFSPAHDHPVRVDFFGDEIDTLSFFDPETQRREERVRFVAVLPVRESLTSLAADGCSSAAKSVDAAAARAEKKGLLQLGVRMRALAERMREESASCADDRLIPFIFREISCLADYLSEDTLLILDDPSRLQEAADGFSSRMEEDVRTLIEDEKLYGPNARFFVRYDRFLARAGRENVLLFSTFQAKAPAFPERWVLSLNARQLPSYGGSFETAAEDVRAYLRSGYRTLILCGSPERAERMCRMLSEHDVKAVPLGPALPAPGTAAVGEGKISSGMEYPGLMLAVIAEGQIFSERKPAKRKKSASARDRVRSYSDLSPGDLVVHDIHGIGRYTGIERMTVDGAERDYIRIAFRGADVLYVPAASLEVISKYVGGGEDSETRLSKLGGIEWQKQKARAKKAASDMADRLIALYAERQSRPGFACIPDDSDQAAFEDRFDYEETEDQLRCTHEIKLDMERPVPMDRLLCGDVGFGKTEVALRAAMKCILSGRQAALLAPTAVLARQHYLTACRRFEGTGVQVEWLSRKATPSEQARVLSRTKGGQVDLLIGTHRLLQKDVRFSSLGLLIVDEEQRFGVTHKEAMKELTRDVDVLTLTATPIPRTLGMALSGIRDMSVIEEAPINRQPVTTYVLEYDRGILLEAIRRELSRGGQVYYLHNRVETIDRTAARLAEALPGAQVSVLHGRMNEELQSDVMQRLSDGDIQVLVCTTIIETGVDVPNVNTLIVEDAENLGLAQLHQLRGRVGRSARRAFAYFTYRPGRALTEIAQKRLSAIREFAEFGAGFKIAMRDLEIRGAGNVLGAEQSGHMASVGYDMYLNLLEEAIRTKKGDPPEEAPKCPVDLMVSANLPPAYVEDSGERMELYRRIAMIRSEDDRSDLIDELLDRYGDPPPETVALLDISLMRAEAGEAGIRDLSQKGRTLVAKLAVCDLKKLGALCALPAYKGRLLLSAGSEPYLTLRLHEKQSPLKEALQLVADFRG